MKRRQIVIIAGMPRAATTSIYFNFVRHPSIFTPIRKELNFFSYNYHLGKRWYLSFYNTIQDNQVGVDVSPLYFLTPNAPARIGQFYSNVKVILILRDPVQWIISLYRYIRKHWGFDRSFSHLIQEGIWFQKGNASFQIKFKPRSLINRIELFRSIFTDKLLMCKYETFKKNPIRILSKIEEFLDIPHFYEQKNIEKFRYNTRLQRSSHFLRVLKEQPFLLKYFDKFISRKLGIQLNKLSYQLVEKRTNDKEVRHQDLKTFDLAQKTFSPDKKYMGKLFRDNDILTGV